MFSKLWFIAAVFVLFSSMAQAQEKEGTITVSGLRQAMAEDSSLVILDVRTPEELTGQLGKIDGALNIPLQQLEDRINELADLKYKNVAVICRSGVRSAKAQKILSDHGIKSKSVAGGMIEFRKTEKE